MNLLENPTESELAALLARCNDRANSHVLWVEHGGQVHLDPIPNGLSSLGFARLHEGKMRIRHESFAQGNDYTGIGASEDAVWVSRLFLEVVAQWDQGFEGHSIAWAEQSKL